LGKATDFHCKCKPRCGVLSPLLAMTASRVNFDPEGKRQQELAQSKRWRG